jgi:hypothetical protein
MLGSRVRLSLDFRPKYAAPTIKATVARMVPSTLAARQPIFLGLRHNEASIKERRASGHI